MDGPLCPCCGNWRQAADERFCGLCGAGLVPMPVTQLASFTFADAPEKGLRDGRLAFRFEPTPEPAGPPLRVALVVDQTGERLGFTVPNDLEIDDTGNSDLLVDSDRMPASGPVSGRLVHEAEDGREVATLAQFGLRLPEPSFEVVPQTIELTEAGLRTGRVRVRLRCTDGLLAPLEAIRLSEPGRSEDPDIETALPGRAGGGTVLRVGEEVPVDLRIARRLADALRDSPAGLRRTLNVLLPGRSAQTLAATPLLRLDRPAQPVFDLPRRLDAMAGADLFLPVAIANKGAAPAALGKIALLGEGPADAAPVYAERDLAGWTLEGGGRAAFALDVPADGPAAELLATPGNRRVRLVQRFAGSAVAPLESELTLAVRGARTCNDILAIDFGTTESAAALLDAAGRSEPLELQLGDTGSFVPTVIAYRPGSDGRSVATVGAPARALARDPDARDLQYFDNIKWRLATPDTHELPGGEEVGWTRIAADYIAELKRRIEGHPAVAARIDAAYVTRPARFDAHAIGALKAAFRQAGIEPLLLAAHDAEPTTISESWPPVITGLARPNLDSLRRRALDTSESIFGTEPTGAVHHVLTVDVGGGSSDLSAF
jgi:hypothetical protein